MTPPGLWKAEDQDACQLLGASGVSLLFGVTGVDHTTSLPPSPLPPSLSLLSELAQSWPPNGSMLPWENVVLSA